MFTRRRLPHWKPDEAVVFVTWKLALSFPESAECLIEPRIADLVSKAIHYGVSTRRYELYAWVIMPNHVHMIIKPVQELSSIMHWLKGRTGRVANRILGRTGAFWQDESFDHWIRCDDELQELIEYVEDNPLKAGLAEKKENWRWSSATSE